MFVRAIVSRALPRDHFQGCAPSGLKASRQNAATWSGRESMYGLPGQSDDDAAPAWTARWWTT
jgi:hypothetical protein